MRQAIVTKYLGATNTRGSRIKATAAAGSISEHWDYALNVDENHARAAKTFAAKLGLSGYWAAGGMPAEAGNCFVWIGDEEDAPTIQGTDGADWFLVSSEAQA